MMEVFLIRLSIYYYCYYYYSCGIVLCSRDAKFAVDCDTCRLSYCLVCLASGSKDPCVRCGHRPSKRMEQLVHLRLKSIYKAFQQQSSSSKKQTSKSSSSHRNYAAASHPPWKKNGDTNNGPTIEELEEGMEDDYSKYHHSQYHHSDAFRPSHPTIHDDDDEDEAFMMAAATATAELAGKVLEEQEQQAEQAAAALIAELQQEEEEAAAAKTKKSKKKKKKKNAPVSTTTKKEGDHDKDGKPEAKEETAASKPMVVAAAATPPTKKDKKNKAAPAAAAADPPLSDSSSMEEMMMMPNAVKEPEQFSPPKVPKQQPPKPKQQSEEDAYETRLVDCVDRSDIHGIEDIVFELKGVPGRAALRKNAKKALKRLLAPTTAALTETKADEDPLTATRTNNATPAATATVATPAAPKTTGTLELLRLVSDRVVPGKHANVTRAECVMQMSPIVVGWVIGKGGQRIRDLMEESGARIWIDQEKANPEDARNVYISGDRKAVDQAVYMVRDIISKAPIAGAEKYAPTSKAIENPQEPTAAQIVVGVPAAPATDHLSEHQPPPPPPPPGLPDGPPAPPLAMESMEPLSFLNSAGTEEKYEHIMTCEARFVPLLIGKRGWAIKDIQDKSGARVDIDQTITPRQIRISGLKTNVDKAILMVRDVLNYPHAQPGENDQLPHNSEDKADERPHTPPPYSYITTNDARSAISASSSLSSTPEPSKAAPAQFATGPLIPPADYHLTPNANMHMAPPGGHYLPQDMPARGSIPGSNPNMYNHTTGTMGVGPRQPPGMGMSPHNNMKSMYHHASGQPQMTGHGHGHSFGMIPSNMVPPRHQQQYDPTRGPLPIGGDGVGGAIFPGHGRYDTPHAASMAMPGGVGGWNQPSHIPQSRPALPEMTAGLGLGGPPPSSNTIPARSFGNHHVFQPPAARGPTMPDRTHTGLSGNPSIVLARSPNAAFSSLGGTGDSLKMDSLRDDSRLIDSLFGQTSKESSAVPGAGLDSTRGDLLSGLSGLNLGAASSVPPSSGGGLWDDAPIPSWNATSGRSGIESSTTVVDPTLNQLLNGLPALDSSDHDKQQHPPQSRFHWGANA